MEIIVKNIGDIFPYENNPRKNEKAVGPVAESLKEFGWQQPIVIDKDNIIVAGHTRWEAAQRLGLKEVPCIIADNLTPDQVRAYRLADNKTAEFAKWDPEALLEEYSKIKIDMTKFGFDPDSISTGYTDYTPGALKADFIVPPFSVLDARNAEWQERKREWKKIMDPHAGRPSDLIKFSDGIKNLDLANGQSFDGTSNFDPVLAEIMIHWFSPASGKILDPFAGGPVRGEVAAMLGRRYTGVDLRPEQIEANEAEWLRVAEMPADFYGGELQRPHWITGDSLHIDELVKEKNFDIMLTCPPYADLEKYSDKPEDLSNMEFDDFCRTYRDIIKKSVAKLSDNAFAVCVVGEVRDKRGRYREFINETVQAFKAAGMEYYNEIILITAVGTGGLRARRIFAKRHVVPIHQKALVFLKEKTPEALDAWIDSFDRIRATQEMHQNVLVFLKGDSDKVDKETGRYKIDLF